MKTIRLLGLAALAAIVLFTGCPTESDDDSGGGTPSINIGKVNDGDGKAGVWECEVLSNGRIVLTVYKNVTINGDFVTDEWVVIDIQNNAIVTWNANLSNATTGGSDLVYLTGNGRFSVAGGNMNVKSSDSYAIYCTSTTVEIEISGGTLLATGDSSRVIFNNGSVTVNGGNMEINKNGGIAIQSNGNVTVNKGTITAKGVAGTAVWAGNVTVNGGTITASGVDGWGIFASGDITVNKGNVSVSKKDGIAIYSEANVVIKGGTITASDKDSTAVSADVDILITGSITLEGFIMATNVDVRAGGTLIVAAGKELYIYGDLVNNGTINNNGDIYYYGTFVNNGSGTGLEKIYQL